MSLVCKKVVSGSALWGLWKISESLETLQAAVSLSAPDQQLLSKKVSERKKKEWLAVRCLLGELINENARIVYDGHGRPFLADDSHHISISHSDEYAALYLHKTEPAGIDIQKIKRDIGKGTDFFLNDAEQLWIDKKDFILMNILWSAKETLYKYAGIYGLNPRNQMSVEPFTAGSNGIFTAAFTDKTSKTIQIHYEIFEDYVLTRTL